MPYIISNHRKSCFMTRVNEVSIVTHLANIIFLMIRFHAAAQIITLDDFMPQHSVLREYEKIPVTWKGTGQVQMHFNEGLNSLDEERYDLAVENFTRVIELDNDNWQAYYYRGVALKMMMRLGEAATDFEKLLRLNKNLAEAWLELGKIRQIQFLLVPAEECYNKVGKAKPALQPEALFLTGTIYLQQNDPTVAEKKFKECLEINPNYHNARINLALIEATKKNSSEAALPHLEKILEKDSVHRYALQLYAFLQFKNNPLQSLKSLSTLTRHYPTNLMYPYLRGLIYTEMKQYEKAFNDFQKILQATQVDENRFRGQQTPMDKRIDIQYAGYYILSTMYGLPDADIPKIKKSYCLFLTGQFDEGIKNIQTIRNYKSHPLTLFLLGLGNEHNGNHEEAWGYYNAALKLDSDIQDAHTKVGIYNTNVGNWNEAEKHFSESLRINPKLHALYKLRGVSRFFLKDYQKAIADFTRYLEYDSTDSETLRNRAFAYRMSGKITDGLNDYLRSDPRSFKVDDYYPFLTDLLEQKDTVNALRYLRKIYSIKPEDEKSAVLYVELLTHTKHDDEAKKIFRELTQPGNSLNPFSESSLRVAMAIIHRREKRYKEAEEALTKAIRLYENPRAYRERGMLYLQLNNPAKAQADLKKASNLGDKQARDALKIFEN